ncbi:hypothetical protein FRB99_004570, partial [Tulasnella sp. 403]
MSTSTALKDYSTCEISDALVKLGIKTGGHIPDIGMLSPAPDGSDTRICGPAYTVQMVLADDKHSPSPDKHFVDGAPEGSVVVISAPSQVKSAVWGGLMTAGAQARGALGVVIDGRCRDVSEHRAASFPVFARGRSTLGQGGFTRPSALNISVAMASARDGEQVVIKPGDMMVADEDGVICVPLEVEGEVVERCRVAREVDARCLNDIRAGKGVAASFK